MPAIPSATPTGNTASLAALIWSVADLLRGDFKQSQYGRIILPFTVKLAFHPHDSARLDALQADKRWNKLDPELQSALLAGLEAFAEDKLLSRDRFKKQLAAQMKGIKLPAPAFKLICKHIGEQDDEAEVCKGSSGKEKGQPEPNPDLRDNENVPLSEDVEAYFAREVLPHVPDAWIDTSKVDAKDGQVGIVGYEIPFNRHFYQYQPPHSLETTAVDLDAVSREIMLCREARMPRGQGCPGAAGLLAEVHS